jgi:hypothetical protein
MKVFSQCAAFALLLALSLAGGVAHAEGKAKESKKENKKEIVARGRRGPMKVVAVLPGTPGVDQIVVDALLKTEQFVVVERGLAPVAPAETEAAQQTSLASPQLFIQAIVSHLDERKGWSIGWEIENFRKLIPKLGGDFGPTKAKAVVFVRGFDPQGNLLTSQRAEGSGAGRKLVVGAYPHLFSGDSRIGIEQFKESSVGRALQQAVEKGVKKAVAQLNQRPWEARIAAVEGEQIFLNAGAAEGLRAGDQFIVARVTRTITDPGSGAVLEQLTEPVGRVEVVKVFEHTCVARALQGESFKQGDLAREAR